MGVGAAKPADLRSALIGGANGVSSNVKKPASTAPEAGAELAAGASTASVADTVCLAAFVFSFLAFFSALRASLVRSTSPVSSSACSSASASASAAAVASSMASALRLAVRGSPADAALAVSCSTIERRAFLSAPHSSATSAFPWKALNVGIALTRHSVATSSFSSTSTLTNVAVG